MLEAIEPVVKQIPSVTSAVAGSSVDLTTLLASFGLSFPLFLWLLKMHKDLISVVIPRGFLVVRREMRRQGRESRERHEEWAEIMKIVTMRRPGRARPKRRGKERPTPNARNGTRKRRTVTPTKAKSPPRK